MGLDDSAKAHLKIPFHEKLIEFTKKKTLMSLLIQIYKKIYWSVSSLLKFGPRIIPIRAKRPIKAPPTAAAEGLKPPIAVSYTHLRAHET